MDADLQHDERLLSEMLSVLQLGKADLVIGSRYASGGGANGFSALRQSISRVATQWGRRLTGIAVHDPMSGFFMMRRDLLDQIAPELSSEGFKILFDILTTAGRRKLSIVEIPYGFRARLNGSSKFDCVSRSSSSRSFLRSLRIRPSLSASSASSPSEARAWWCSSSASAKG